MSSGEVEISPSLRAFREFEARYHCIRTNTAALQLWDRYLTDAEKANLKKARLFIVVFGAGARTWVEHRLQEAFKIILSHQLKTRIGVYVAPPVKPPDQVAFPPLFDVALNMDGFDPATLDALIKKAALSRA